MPIFQDDNWIVYVHQVTKSSEICTSKIVSLTYKGMHLHYQLFSILDPLYILFCNCIHLKAIFLYINRMDTYKERKIFLCSQMM